MSLVERENKWYRVECTVCGNERMNAITSFVSRLYAWTIVFLQCPVVRQPSGSSEGSLPHCLCDPLVPRFPLLRQITSGSPHLTSRKPTPPSHLYKPSYFPLLTNIFSLSFSNHRGQYFTKLDHFEQHISGNISFLKTYGFQPL